VGSPLLRYCAYQNSVDLSACLSTLFSRLFRRENEFVYVFGVLHTDADRVDISEKRAVRVAFSTRILGVPVILRARAFVHAVVRALRCLPSDF